jgi:hypothetical protein
MKREDAQVLYENNLTSSGFGTSERATRKDMKYEHEYDEHIIPVRLYNTTHKVMTGCLMRNMRCKHNTRH